jgi:hypothetical protein
MLEPDQWSSITDLRGLIENQVPENLTLEFKGSRALAKEDGPRKELTKDISALANSAGGVIIYGIIEDRQTHVAKELDAGVDLNDIPPEWIDQVANGGIHPRVEGLRVRMIDTEEPTQGNRKYFVVTVPESHTAHMAQDHRYHKRWGREVRAMEDYEVRDVMARSTVPRLKVEITSTSVADPPYTIDIQLWLRNEAITPAEWCVVQIVVPEELNIVDNGGAHFVESTTSDTGRPVTTLRFDYGGINVRPIWKELRVNPLPAGRKSVRISAPTPDNYPLFWRTTAPRMGWLSGREVIAIS